jgi:hypothetical protein
MRESRLPIGLAFGWRSGLPHPTLLLGGAAVYRCDNQPVFNAGFSRCGDTASYQGIALAMPLVI